LHTSVKWFSVTGNKNLICIYHRGFIISDWEELPSPFLHSILLPTCAYVQHIKEEQCVSNKDEKI